MRRARLIKPWRGYTSIDVDMDSYKGCSGGCQYRCIVCESGAEIWCYEDEFEFED